MSAQKLHIVRHRKPRDPHEARRRRIGAALPTPLPLPFRWEITQEPQLGSLLDGQEANTCDTFLESLLALSARVISCAGDCDLVFVGRSPESLFDLLSGLMADTPRRLSLLQISVRFRDFEELKTKRPDAIAAFRTYLDWMGLSPTKLIIRERPIAFVDLVVTGGTFQRLLSLLYDWTTEEKADWPAVRRKLRLVAIVRQIDTKPKLQSWRDESREWLADFLPRGGVSEVTVPERFWDFLADRQDKTTRPYCPESWGKASFSLPRYSDWQLKALRVARRLYVTGCSAETRVRFATALTHEEVAMRQAWYRTLVQEVRGS